MKKVLLRTICSIGFIAVLLSAVSINAKPFFQSINDAFLSEKAVQDATYSKRAEQTYRQLKAGSTQLGAEALRLNRAATAGIPAAGTIDTEMFPFAAVPEIASTCTTYTATVTYSDDDVTPFQIPDGISEVTIQAVGGNGGNSLYASQGGKGASVTGKFTFSPSGIKTIYIIPGQKGGDELDGTDVGSGGGGGGTFISTNNDFSSISNVLLIAGGGGGGGNESPVIAPGQIDGNNDPDANKVTSAVRATRGNYGATGGGGGSFGSLGQGGGAGGNSTNGSGGGTGFSTSGEDGVDDLTLGGKKPADGAAGGLAQSGTAGEYGGYGGGGAANNGGGGGGGYSGGGGGGTSNFGGGGGSYLSSSAVFIDSHKGEGYEPYEGNGYVVITWKLIKPVIGVSGNSIAIANGQTATSVTDLTDYGTVSVGASVPHTFSIKNTGNANLTITGIAVTNVANFSVATPVATTLAPNASTTFTANFAPSSVGTKTATVSIYNNDACVPIYTYNITGTGSASVPQVPATALNFDGVNDKVTVNNTTLGNFGAGDFTVEMSMRTTLSSGIEYLATKRGFCGGDNFWSLQVVNGKLNMEMQQSVSAPTNYVALIGTTTISDGLWHHVALTRKNGTVNIYVDGALELSSVATIANINNSYALEFGSSVCNVPGGNGSVKFVGDMDEIRIWSRALCTAELDHNRSCELALPQTGLQAYYKLNAGFINANNAGVTSAVDATGNGNTGTLSNFGLIGTTTNWVAGVVTGTCSAYNPVVSNITGSGTVCAGSTTQLSNATPGGSWSSSNNGIATINVSGLVTGVAAGTATISYTSLCEGVATFSVTVNPLNAIGAGSNRTVCISSAMTSISLTTTGATGATFAGLPAGVTGSWAANTVTISGTPTVSGTFNYTVSTTGGCPSATATGTITVSSSITPSFTQVGPVCSGSGFSLPTTSNNGITGTWSPAINNTTTTTYTFTPNAGQCGTSTTMTVTVIPATTIATGENRTICVNAAITPINLVATDAISATFAGLPTGVTGSWISNTATISGVPFVSGTFNYTVTAIGGCAPVTASGIITVTPQNMISAGADRSVCINSAIASISLTTTGATGATFAGLPAGVAGSWAANTITISGTPTISGTFNYTVTTTGGCTPATASGTITVSSSIIPTFTQVGPVCSGSGFSLPTTSNNGITGTWSPAINNTTTTTYTFTPNAGQCGASTTMTVTVIPATTIATGENRTICINAAITPINLVATGAISATFAGLPTGVTGSWISNTATISGVPFVSGTFNYTVTVEGNCAPATATGTIVVNPAPTSTAGPDVTVCANTSSISLTGSSFTGGTGATWSTSGTGTFSSVAIGNIIVPAAGGCCCIDGTYTPGPSFNGAPSWVKNQYYIRWNGSAWVMSENGLYPAGYFTSTSGSPTTIPANGWTLHSNCGGGSNLTFSGATGVINLSYSYAPSAADVAAGSVNLTYTTNGGSCGTAQSVKKITFTTLTTPAFNQVAAICSGASLTALPTTSINGITGTWSPALNNTTTTTYTFTPTAGQCASTATMTITVNPLPSGFTVGGGGSYCAGGNGVTVFTGGSTTGVSYDLMLNGNVVTTLPGTGSDLYFNNITTAGTYTVIATNQTTGCKVQMPGSSNVSINTSVTPTFTQVAAICSGATLSALPTTSNNGIIGTWSPALNNTATTTYTFTPNANQCAATATMTITVTNVPTPTITRNGPSVFCQGGSITLTSSSATGNVWSPGGATTQSITVSASGNYTVTVNNGACSATSLPFTVTVNPLPTVTANTVNPVCVGEKIELFATPPGASYAWTGPNGFTSTDHNPVILNAQVANAGTYTVVVTDANGCSASATTTSIVNTLPVIHAGSNSAVCEGDTLKLTSNGGVSYIWNGPNGFASTDQNPVLYNVTSAAAGTYFVKGTGVNGCRNDASVAVAITPKTVPTFTQVAAICSGASLAALPTTSLNGITGAWSPALNNTATTTYTFAAFPGQCATTATMTITVNTNVIPTFTQVAAICSGASLSALPTTSNNGITGVWSPGLNSTATTTYTFTPSAGQCATTTTMTITVNPLPTITGTLVSCAGWTRQLTGSGTPAAVNPWTSSDPSIATVNNTGVVTGVAVAGGSAVITYTDANGCSATANYTVPPLPPTPTVSVVNNCDGTSVLTASGYTSYQWAMVGGQVTATGTSITVSATGTWGVRSASAQCVSAFAYGTAAPKTTPVVNILPNGPTTFCAGGSVVLNANTVGGLTYSWTGGSTNSSITVTTSGTYTLTATNAGGCSASASVTVTVNPLPIKPFIIGVNSICQGGSTVLSSSTSTGNHWSNGSTDFYITVGATSTHTVTVTDGNGCQATSEPFTVTVNPLPVITGISTICVGGTTTLTATGLDVTNNWSSSNPSIVTVDANGLVTGVHVNGGMSTISYTNQQGCTGSLNVYVKSLPDVAINPAGPIVLCAGQSVTLNANTEPGLTYVWTGGSTGSSLLVNASGTYTLTGTNSFGCSSSASVTVTVNPLPPVPTISGNASYCQGSATILTSSATTGNHWNFGPTTQSVTVGAGTYTVIVTDANNCFAISAPFTVTENPLPTISGTPSVCAGGTRQLTGSGTPAAGLAWVSTNPSIATVDNNGLVTAGATPGNVLITYTNSNGCTGGVLFTVTHLPFVSINPGGSTTFCSGQSIVLNAATEPGLTYSWNPGGSSASSITVNTSGVYTLTGTNVNGCVSSASITVTVNPLPTISGALNVCVGSTTTLTGSGTPAAGNAWTSSNFSVAAVNNSGVVSGFNAGTATITYTNSNGCSQSVNVTVINKPLVGILPNGPTTFCAGGSVVLNANAEPGLTYSWSPGGSTASSITVNTSGTYTLTGTNSNGCSRSDVVTVTVNPLPPVPTISGNTSFCQGGSTVLTSSSATGNFWSNGQNTQSITVFGAGTYSVTVTNANNCQATSAPVTVTVNPKPVINVNVITNVRCFGGNDGSIDMTVSSGTAPYTYSWSNGAATEDISGLTAGSYTLTVTDAAGCSQVMTQVISQPAAAISFTTTQSNIACFGGSTGSITISAIGGTPGYNYVTNGGVYQGSNTFTNLTAGTYNIRVRDSRSCFSDIQTVIITEAPQIQLFTVTGGGAYCFGGAGIAVGLSGSEVGVSYQLKLNGSIFAGSPVAGTGSALSFGMRPAGTYTVVASTSVSCNRDMTGSAVITQTANPPTLTYSSTYNCDGSVNLTANNATGSILWSPTNETTATILVTTTGVYSAVQTVNGCTSNNAPITVTTITPPSVFTVSGGGAYCGSVTGATVQLSGSEAGVSYALFLGAAQVGLQTGNGGPIVFNVATPGTYTIKGNRNPIPGSCAVTMNGSAVVVLNAIPAAPVVTVVDNCNNTSTLSTTATGSLLWSTNETTSSITVNSAGVYTVTQTVNGCTSAAGSGNASPKTTPVIALESSPSNTNVCDGNVFVMITSNTTQYAGPGVSYNWTVTGPQALTRQSNGAEGYYTLNSLNTPGTYTFTLAVTVDGCTSNTSNTVTVVVPAWNAPVLPDIHEQCEVAVLAPVINNACGQPVTGTTSDPVSYTGQGTNVIHWTFTDANGRTITINQNVILLDVTPPVAHCPANISVAASTTNGLGQSGALVSYEATATDNCGAAITYSIEPGSFFPVGTTTVIVTATDMAGLTNTCSFDVTVRCVIATPIITAGGPTTFCPGGSVVLTSSSATGNVWNTGANTQSITVNASGSYSVTVTDATTNCSATSAATVVTVEDVTAPATPVLPTIEAQCSATAPVATTTDNCVGTVIGTTSDALTYSTQGDHVIHWTFRDPSGNTTTAEQHVIIRDVTAPVAVCPANISVAASTTNGLGQSGALVSYTATATDNCSATVSYSIAPGSFFPVGTTTVKVIATDVAGNKDSCTFDVTVRCVIATPTITAGGPTTFCPGGSVVLTSSSATGNMWSTGANTQSITVNASGSYSVTVTDAATNCSATSAATVVTVEDVTPPTIVCPAPVTVQCASAVPAVNIASVTATDNCSVVVSHVSDVISNQVALNKFTITRTYQAIDPSGNAVTCTQIITVNDNTAPTLIVANSLPGNSGGQCLAGVPGAPATATIAALYTDNCTGTVTAVLSNTTTTGSNATGWTRKYFYTVTDASGNSTTACVTYSGRDTQNPIANVATLPTVTAECGATVTPPTATDNCAGTITATTSNPLTYSAQGTYTITWTYSDGNGNTSTQTQTVIVKDVTPPAINCPSDITVTANTTVSSVPGAYVNYTVTATDNCGIPTITYSKASGSFFAVGTTTVIATANDGNGNTSSCSFNVIVNCVTPTFTTCPANKSVSTDPGVCTAVVTYASAATGTAPVACSYTFSGATTGSGTGNGSGKTFNKGVTTVTITASNLCGTATCSFTVTVADNENPIIVNLPANISKTNDAGVCGAVVTWSTVSATDNCPGVILTSNHVSGETYPVGTTTVTYTATDAGGRTVNGSFNVTVTDTQKPAVVCPSDIVVTANTTSDGSAGYIANYSVTATDNCGVQSTTYSKASGSFFPIGTTPVTVTVTDVNGNTQTCTFNVVVNCVAPTFTTCPANKTVGTDAGACTAVVTYTSAATGTAPVACTYTFSGATTGSGNGNGSGKTFNKGTTTVTITASNLCGTVTCSFTVTVNDTQAPVITCPANVTVACGLPTTPANAGTATATDNCSGAVTITYTDAVSGNTTTRTWKATDAAGNFSTCTQTITQGGPFITSIASVKTSNVYVGANVPSTTLFIGYGAQSTTLQTNVPAGTYTYAWSGASVGMLSNTTSANPVFTPTQGGNYTFTVTVSSALGCVSTSSITICVTDIRVFASTNDNCSHQSHNSYNCPHQGHSHSCSHQSHGSSSCPHGSSGNSNNNSCSHQSHSSSSCTHNNHGHSCSHQSHGSSSCPDGNGGGNTNNSCSHQSHSSSNCSHQGHSHSCSHQSHSSSNCSDKDDDDDHQTMCNHQSHSSYDCSHKGHNHTCSHRSHSSYSCSHRGTNDRDDDDEKDCNHQSHSSSDCSHRGHNHNSCNHQSHSSNSCSHHKNNTTQQTVCNHQSHSSNDCNHNGHNHNTCNHKSHSSSDCVHNNNGSNGGCDDDDEDDDKKVYICHVPPGNPGNPLTLSISINAVAAHLANHSGDRLGSCAQTPCTGYSDTEKPVIDCPDNKAVTFGSSTLPAVTGSPEADDNSGDVIITYSDVSTKGTNAAIASFYNYTITRTWKAADLAGNFSTCPQIITVTETVKPVITCPPAITVACGSTAPASTGTATATDNASPVTITYTDAVSGNTTTRTWRATDAAGNYATCTQAITVVDNVKPVISDVADVTVNCGSSTAPSATGTATAMDNCSTATVTYSDVPGTNKITRTWKATDAAGNYITSTQVINIVDLVKPTITVPANSTISCGASTAPSSCGGSATGTDNCSSVTVSYTDVTAGNVITRTWKTTDASGNFNTGVQTITIVDNVKPVISDVSDITVSCGSSTTPSGCGSVATATDNCSTPVVTYTDVPGVNKITRTWKATDAAGNFSTSTQIITIVDNTKPVLTEPADITVSCGASTLPAATGNATATDNCSAVTISYTDATSGNKITRTWKATDAAGNYETDVQVITISDAVKPVITDVADKVLNCGGSTLPANTGTATATDNCSTPTVTYSDVTSGNVITRTWKATDAAGNYSTSTQTITLGSTFTATLSSVPSNSTYTGGVSTNLYIGYGAQSTTLQMCSLPTSGAPYTYAWSGSYTNKLNSTTSASPLFTPSTFGYYTFSVTVTNKFGCTSTTSISICVTDIRVAGTSGSGAKVYMCHTPSGYNKTPQTIQVLVSQVPSHLSASSCGSDGNDKLGSCGQSPCNTTVVNSIVGNTLNATKEGTEKVAPTEEELKVIAMPNPSTTYFTLKIESKYETPVSMRVMDGTGRVVDAKSKIGANSTIQIGHNYSSGTYYAELTQGTQRKVVQLIKGRG